MAIIQYVDLVRRGFYDEQPNLVVRLAKMLSPSCRRKRPLRMALQPRRGLPVTSDMNEKISRGAIQPRRCTVVIYARVSTSDRELDPGDSAHGSQGLL